MRRAFLIAVVLAGGCRRHTIDARELERLRAEQRELRAQISALQATVDDLRRVQAAAPVIVHREPPQALPPGGHITRAADGRLALSGTGPAEEASGEPSSAPAQPAAGAPAAGLRAADLHAAPLGAAPSSDKPDEAAGLLDQLHQQMEQLKRSQAAEQQALDELGR